MILLTKYSSSQGRRRSHYFRAPRLVQAWEIWTDSSAKTGRTGPATLLPILAAVDPGTRRSTYWCGHVYKYVDGDSRMKYVWLIFTDQQVWISAEPEESCQKPSQFKSTEAWLGADPLPQVITSIGAGVCDGTRLVTDGPFAETHEQLRA